MSDPADVDFPRRPSRAKKIIKPKPVTSAYLKLVSAAYLAQRAASRSMLQQVLKRRSLRRMQVKTLDEAALALIAAMLDELTTLGLLDDNRYASGRAATLQRKGLPARRIAMGLRQKGVDRETIATAMAEPIDELVQARRFAERKRLGPWRSGLSRADAATRDEKDLRALMRAGFNYRVAKAALAAGEE
jgi:regulatory protein